MKKKVLLVASLFIFFISIFSLNAGIKRDLSGLEEGYCPNGCVEGSGGCYCKGYYPEYAEANWG